MNYFLDGRINRAEILFPGVACFLIAVFLGAAVHSSNAKDDEQRLNTVERRGVELRSDFAGKAALALSCPPAKEVIEASNWNPEGEGVLEEKIT